MSHAIFNISFVIKALGGITIYHGLSICIDEPRIKVVEQLVEIQNWCSI